MSNAIGLGKQWLRVAVFGWIVGAHASACTSGNQASSSVAGHAGMSIAGRSSGVAGSGGAIAIDAGAASLSPNTGKGASSGDAHVLRAAIAMNQVDPASEQHVCVIVELPNTQAAWVDDIHATISTGSHHLIVDRRSSSTDVQLGAAPCSPTMAGDDTRLLIAQQPDTRVTLPSGVAYRLEAHQRIFLQLHYINLSTKPEDIQAAVELRLADTSAGTPVEAKSLFAGALSIDLPAHSPGNATSFQVPGKSIPSGMTRHVFALTSHTHSLGVRATIERVGSADAPATTPIHESLSWSEPPLTLFDPTLDFKANSSDGLRLICNYMNNTDHAVMFGTAFEDEMCFMWMYFYDE